MRLTPKQQKATIQCPTIVIIGIVLIAWIFCLATPANAQAQARGEVKVYIAQNESAKVVLRNLLSMFGKRLVADGLSSTPVSGRFEARSAEEVMTYFQGAYEINWFQNGTTVYVYNVGDWGTRRIYVGGDRSNEDWKELFNSAGLNYKEFKFVYNSDSKELIVSGPRSYFGLVETAFKQERPDPSEQDKYGVQLMVFPLKHASVEDRQTKLRDNTVVTPGVLSVLLNLLGLPAQSSMYMGDVSGTSRKMSTAPGFSQRQDSGNSPMIVAGRVNKGSPSAPGETETGKTKDPLKEPAVSVTADPRTNSILIRDAKSKYNYYKELIDQLDKPVAMIEVEAMMVEVSEKALNELGMEFGLLGRHLAYDFPGQSVGRSSVLGLSPGASSIVNPTQFLARLRALAADENAKVLARPTILTQDNVSAYIDLSQTLYLQVAGERVADVVPVTAGSLLQVTPRVVYQDSEERIFLRIEIQDGSLNSDTSGIQTPRIQNTSLSTQAVIQREKAILVGGYNREYQDSKDYKIPFLGSLPVIGKVFSSTERKSETVARLFLITPRLIEGAAHQSNTSQKALTTLQKSFKLGSEPPANLPTFKLDSKLAR